MRFISSDFIGIPHCLDCASSPEGFKSFKSVCGHQASTEQLVADGSVLFLDADSSLLRAPKHRTIEKQINELVPLCKEKEDLQF